MTVTDSEPTPTPHTAGSGVADAPADESTRACADARARTLSVPPVPELLRVWVIGDPESSAAEFWRSFLRRCKRRVDYALTGEWTAPPPLKENGKPKITPGRFAYLVLTVLIGCSIAFVLDFIDWATFPLGRLAITVPIVWLIAANL